MIDIHSHILFNIDDGSQSIEESINIIKCAVENGYKKIIFTPHYIKDSKYSCNNEDKHIIFEELKREIIKNNISIEIYLGNEVYIDDEIVKLLENNEIMTLNNSKYILIELPLNSKIPYIKNIIYGLRRRNFIPIIAHPERYMLYFNNIELFEELIEAGALLQGNFMSLFDIYGKHARKMLKLLLKENMITFLGSDKNKETDCFYNKILDVRKKLKKIIHDESKIDDLLNNNIEKVINNEDI